MQFREVWEKREQRSEPCKGRRTVSIGAVACTLLMFFAGVAESREIVTPAREAVLMDATSGIVFFEKNAHERMPSASMSKLMTLAVLFNELKEGRVKLTDRFRVSDNAWHSIGARNSSHRMFVQPNSLVSVEDLIRGVVVTSENDACIVIAEGLASTEAAFVDMMINKAKSIGLRDTRFTNVSGLSDSGQYTTAHDLAVLARHLIRNFPQYYRYFAETTFTWNGVGQSNRNPLLYLGVGADGLKAGYTKEAGYSLIASATRNRRRVILVANGFSSVRQRTHEAQRLLTLALQRFKRYELFVANAKIDEADVWNGMADQVPLVVKDPLVVILDETARKDMKVILRYRGPLVAPVSAGQRVGSLEVRAPGAPTTTIPVYAGAAVARDSLFGQLIKVITRLMRDQIENHDIREAADHPYNHVH